MIQCHELPEELFVKILSYTRVTTQHPMLYMDSSWARSMISMAPHWLLDNETNLELLPPTMVSLKVSRNTQIDISFKFKSTVNYMITGLQTLIISEVIPCKEVILTVHDNPSYNDIMILMRCPVLISVDSVMCMRENLYNVLRRKCRGLICISRGFSPYCFVTTNRFSISIDLYVNISFKIYYDNDQIDQELLEVLSEASGIDLDLRKQANDDSYESLTVNNLRITPGPSTNRYIKSLGLQMTFDETIVNYPQGKYIYASTIRLDDVDYPTYYASHIYISTQLALDFAAPNIHTMTFDISFEPSTVLNRLLVIFDDHPTLQKIRANVCCECKPTCHIPICNVTLQVACDQSNKLHNHEFYRRSK